MASILGNAGQAVSGIINKVKSTWKGMPREQKAEALTTLGLAAAAAFSKPKASAVPVEPPQIAGGGLPSFPSEQGPQFRQFAAAPVPQDASESKFAKRMRKNFGR